MSGSRRRLTAPMLLALLLPGCSGLSHNPAYFPWSLKPFGDIVRTHGKPTGLGYYANFDPHAVRVEVRPLEGVSPVRKPYVLIATVYDDEGKPRRNRRVEWLLEGAGHLLEVDESGHFPGRGYKVDNRYAVSYTNYAEHRVDRGTADPADDFVLRPGQTWCVVTSAVEGDTHVTAYCPEIYNWENNKVVVTTRWVDADWAFPPPAAARAGTTHVLTTTLTRGSDRQPLAGYRVRYRLLDGPPAAFAEGGQEAVAVSDLRGAANVGLVQARPGAGVNRVAIEIIRAPDPSKPSDVGLVLARGETTVDWQAPVVTLDVTAPPSVVVGGELPLTIALANGGGVESRGLTVRLAIPEGCEPVRTDPPAPTEGRDLVWTLGEVGARQTRTLQAVFRATRLGAVVGRATVSTSEGLRGEKTANVEVTPQPKPGLKVEVVPPTDVPLDSPVSLAITVRNTGTGPATDVRLSAGFSAGLAHESGSNPVETPVSVIEAGASRVVPLTLLAKAAGPQTIRVTARGAGGLSDAADVGLTVRRPALSLDSRGPTWRYAGRPGTWTVQVRNSGDTPLNDVIVRYALPPELEFRAAGAGGILQGNEVVWRVDSLPAGGTKELEVTAVARALADKAVAVVTAFAAPAARAETHAEVEVRGLPALRMRVVDVDDPVVVGGRTEYRVEVTNTGTLASRGVTLDAQLSAPLRPLEPRGPTLGRIEGARVVFDPVASLAPGESALFLIPVEATAAGVATFRATLSAQTLGAPVIEEESTSILPAPRS